MKPRILLCYWILISASIPLQMIFAAETIPVNPTSLSLKSDPIPSPKEGNPSRIWIENMQLANGLIESAENSNFVSLYDNALVALVFTLYKDRERTEKILDYFNERLHTEFNELGGGYYQFRNGKGENTRRKWIGDNAWLLIAIKHHADTFQSTKYASMALALENWLRSLQDEDGGLWGGIQANGTRIHKITEGIITAFNAVEGYDEFHKGIISYLENNRWDSHESLLLAWPENPKYKYAMDLHTLGSLIYPSMSKQLLAKVDRYNTRKKATVYGKKIKGYCFDEDQDVIWLEGTAQMVLAFQQSGMESEAQKLLVEIGKTLTNSSLHEMAAGIPYSANQGSNYGTEKLWDHADSSPAISSSAWYIFALQNFNPFQLNGDKNIPTQDFFWLQ